MSDSSEVDPKQNGAGCSLKASFSCTTTRGHHTAARINALIRLFNWEIFDRPRYSTDLAPSDYHLFTKMKVWLATQRFRTKEELMNGVNNWLHNLEAPFFDEGLQKLVSRYSRLNVGDNYIEK
jgi:histone-lysine N-methyltransferase SETMAR